MNESACIVYIGVFLAMPPLLLAARLFDRTSMSWKLLLVVSVVGGWVLVNLAYMFYLDSLQVQIGVTHEVMIGKPESRDNFLLRFGWLLGPVYLLPWLIMYCCIEFLRWMLTTRRA